MANDYRTFALQLDDFARRVGLSGTTVAKRVAFDVFARIVRKTPVDKGRARASWTISVNNADRTVQPDGQASYPVPQVGALNVQPGDSIWISNNLPYIVKLEEGHSQQAPAGMVAVSLAEVDTAMSRLEREGLKDAGL
jgi:hypothetical protein